jgi:hypothetical protein
VGVARRADDESLVEGLDDPLIWSDQQRIVGLSRVFATAAAP